MDRIEFTLNGQRYELSRAVVESRLSGVKPEPIRKHAVRVNGLWFPATQALEVAIGVPRAKFITDTARRHLASLGFPLHGETEARRADPPTARKRAGSRSPATPDRGQIAEWHTEANVQAAVVTHLATAAWRVLSVANTATKERGIDIVAQRNDEQVGVEVKGYPSRNYANRSRAGETKRTAPSTQAGHWFAQGVLAAMRLRGREPLWRSVLALPNFPRYRDLYADTAGSLDAATIEVWWVHDDGTVSVR